MYMETCTFQPPPGAALNPEIISVGGLLYPLRLQYFPASSYLGFSLGFLYLEFLPGSAVLHFPSSFQALPALPCQCVLQALQRRSGSKSQLITAQPGRQGTRRVVQAAARSLPTCRKSILGSCIMFLVSRWAGNELPAVAGLRGGVSLLI